MHICSRLRELFFMECEKCVDMSLEGNSIMHVVTLYKRKTNKEIYKEENIYVYIFRTILGAKNTAIYYK